MEDSNKISGNMFLMINQQVYPLTKAVTTIGRGLDNDIVIQDILVSRYHSEIRYEDDKYVLYDKQSSGGTFLNNKQIEKSILYSGDLILCATTPIMFVSETGPLESAADEQTGDIRNG